MSKKMLINATHPEENRVAIVTDGTLNELDIEVVGKEQTKGNIYKGTVVRVETGLQAAFIDYGAERLGFLQMGEIHPSYYKVAAGSQEQKGRPRISDILHRGQELLLQIVKEERGTKGAALTTFLSLPGRYMVLMPESDTKGISRKIEVEGERKKLKETMASLELPPDIGYIVRTAGIGQTREELGRDLDYLIRLYRNIVALSEKVRAPSLIYRESNLVIRSIRDYFSTDMDEVLIDDPKVFQDARDFFQQVMPEYAHLVKLHQERRPIFARYQIEEQIETISKNKVPLPSGGSIVIDTTEALVAIDVNSGKMASEQGVEATAYKTNLEAASEIGRQLRLRDLGGLIVIDFIDMRDRQHVRDVENRLKDALKHDKARVTVGRISSQFGLLEMSRQRIKAALAEGTYNTCPHCSGTGRIKSVETQAIAFLRKVYGGIARGQISRIEGEVPLDVATYLLNAKREELLELERARNVTLQVKGRPDFIAGQMDLTFQKREKDEKEEVAPVEFTVAAQPGTERSVMTIATAEPAAAHPPAMDKEGAGEPEVKKKRRRRRKKSGEEATDSEKSLQQGELPEPQDSDASATETEAAEKTEKPAEGAPKKRSRRRRKPAKPLTVETATTEGAAETTEETPSVTVVEEDKSAPASPMAGESVEKTAQAAPKKRRRRPARKSAAKGEESDQPSSAEPAPAVKISEGAQTAAPTTQPSTAEKVPGGSTNEQKGLKETETTTAPKKELLKPARKVAAKGDAPPAQPTESHSGEDKSSANIESAAKKPVSRPRKRKTAEKVEAAQPGALPEQGTPGAESKKDAPPATEAIDAEKPAAKKPARRRKPAAKKKTDDTTAE